MRGFDMVSNWATPETVHSSGVQVSKGEQSFAAPPRRRTAVLAVQVRQDLGREARTDVTREASKDKPCEGNQPSAARVGLLAGRVAT